MSLPSFPDKDKTPSREEVINQIISSIAMEELGLSHIINAEGEKLQYALGTIPGITGPEEPLTMEDLLKLNDSVHKTLDSTMMNQFFLKEKLVGALSASVMRGPTGPSGPQGPATIRIDKEVDKLAPEASPTVENIAPDDKDIMLKFGIPRGATGATGSVGTILESYKTYEDLIKDHPKGKQGDAYLVGPELYVWNTDTKKWESVGDLQGPQGVGTTIKGTGTSKAQLDNDFPDGPPEDAYLVKDEIYIWNKTELWHSAGSLLGPTGATGPTGTFDPDQELFGISGTTGSEEVTYEDTLSFTSQTLDITVKPGPEVNIENRASAILPFATGFNKVPELHSVGGIASNVMFAGFGSSSEAVPITRTGFTLPAGDGVFYPFSLAHAITIKRIHFTTANWEGFDPGAGTEVKPFVVLAMADEGESTFTFLENTKTYATAAWIGGSKIPANSTLYGSSAGDINQSVPMGSRLVTCCGLDKVGGDITILGYWILFCGSIYYV